MGARSQLKSDWPATELLKERMRGVWVAISPVGPGTRKGPAPTGAGTGADFDRWGVGVGAPGMGGGRGRRRKATRG